MSLTHWPGRVVSVLFLGGCSLRCPTCPAPHLVGWRADQGVIPLDAVLDAIYRRRRWIEGVVVKGGEPLAHPEMDELLEILRDFGLEIRLDINGTRPGSLKRILDADLVDTVAMEVKAPLDERYERVVGTAVDLKALYRSIELLLSGGVDHEFRTVVRPGVVGEEEVIAIARTIRGAKRYVLRAARGSWEPGRTELRRLARRAARHVRNCLVDGRQGGEDELSAVFSEGQGA